MPGDDQTIDGAEQFLGFEIDGSGFDEHEGQVIHAMTHAWDDPDRVFAAEGVVVIDGAFHFSWPDAYERYTYQPVLFHADVDGDGRCDPSVDHVWGGPSNAWNPSGNEPHVMDVEHGVRGGAHQTGDLAQEHCRLINRCL